MTPTHYAYTLPTTTGRYVLLSTAERDGHPSGQVGPTTTIWDRGAEQTDETAREHFVREVAALAHAPRDVVHQLTMVHRTADGDRVVATCDPFRGDGATIAERRQAAADARAEWPTVTVLRRVRTKGGVAFERGDVAAMEPGDDPDSVTVWSERNGILTMIPRSYVRAV